ncbi:MAG: ABC transporter permease [Chryseolinea sp.]
MIKSYIKTSARNIVRNKLFSIINIVGLGVSMSVGLVMIAMLSDLHSYDKFHEKHDRIYRVLSNHQYLENKNNDFFATTSLKAGKEIKESMAGPEDVAILQREFAGDIKAGEKTIPLTGLWANDAFFNVFSFRMLQGNPATALKEPYSVVLTETASRKLFGNAEPLGKIIVKDKDSYTVTGLVEDVPKFSHFKFDMLASLSTFELQQKEGGHELAWDNIWNTWTYVLLPKGADTDEMLKAMENLSAREDKTVPNTHVRLDLQRMDDIMAGPDVNNQIGSTVGETPVRIFLALTLVVILSACFNYTNLSLARAFRRTKEVGIRKTVGAVKGQVIIQFIVESVSIALLALAFSFILFLIVRPHFITMEQSLQELLVLDLTPGLVFSFVGFAIVVGVIAGVIPALSFARINAIQVFKNFASGPTPKGFGFRKALTVFQYSLSILAITSTMVIHKQYQHFIHFDLGFTTANVLNISLHGNDPERIKKELLELREVSEISQSSIVNSLGGYWATNMMNPNDPADSASVNYNMIDENYLPLHDYTIIAGRNFNGKASDSLETEVIVNEHVLKRFNIAGQDARKAIGEVVKINRTNMTIVGVLKDFHYGLPRDKSNKAVVMRYSKDPNYLNVKILSDNWPSTYSKLESIWRELDPVHPFQAVFYDEQIEESFRGLKAGAKIGGFLSVLVICIASIGLLGMVVFTTEIRLKEISIRKVLGASESGLLLLLSRNFLFLLGISAAIAIPTAYLLFTEVLLPNMENHAQLNIAEMLTGSAVVLLIALVMIISQTRKVASTNPAEVLKNE